MNALFKEQQRFTQWWLWLILIPIGVLPVVGIFQQLILKEEFGDNPMSDFGLILFAVFVFALLGLFLMMRLKTEIDQTEIRISFIPFVKKRIKWTEIKKAEVVNYGFVGGWGIRLSFKYGTVYNIKGNMGLAIELNNGKRFVIGTQREKELGSIVEKAIEQHGI
ncbi:MAG: hypothetical protein PSV36_07495 [Algoriphagus sp.]|nr:hypothetical protein [Algoriphagus sp.]